MNLNHSCMSCLVFVAAFGWQQAPPSAPAPPPGTEPPLPAAVTNDNRAAAGTLTHGTLTLRLEASRAGWRPEDGDGPELPVAAFREENGAALIPGPLLRVPEGTTIDATILNTLANPLTVHGLVTRPASADTTLTVPAGESRRTKFIAGAPGTYSYWASTVEGATLVSRKASDTQLSGALIVDPRGVVASDRVFVITEWLERATAETTRKVAFAINGHSWPHTERLTTNTGETNRWRVVNIGATTHPMHLHGFYFDVTGTGDTLQHRAFSKDAVMRVVTQNLPIGGTMEMSWTPDRPGNWLFHCHLLAHITPTTRFWIPPNDGMAEHSFHDPAKAMAGLILGVTVTGAPVGPAPATKPARPITLVMYRSPGFFQPDDAYAFAMQQGDKEPAAQDITVPGPMLVLTRGEPVEITLKNRMPESTSVHWHGIELESYYDGVAGFSGDSASTTPSIAPGGSTVVRFTPPRAGTFMYHTHSHDNHQLASGLYGGIVVLEPGETFDGARDHLIVLGQQGAFDPKRPTRMPVVVNGATTPALTLKAGVPNRLRFVNITPSGDVMVSVNRMLECLEWSPVAKDGATLPDSQQTRRLATQYIAVGETYDFVMTPTLETNLWLDVRMARTGQWARQVPITVVR
jgi:FtsP/CotA-like multicopper oxidase with cupredoxin domain